MYVAVVPNRNSPPAILLREGYREDGRVKTRTLANITNWKPERIEAFRRALKGEFDGIALDVDPIVDKNFGILFALKKLADRLGITKALGKSRLGKIALFLVLARIADRGSRLSAVRWSEDHCVEEILGLDSVNGKEIYNALEWLYEKQAKIEKKLFDVYIRNKGETQALVLYDVTSSYLEGDCNELAAFGYDRDGKKGKKQIVVGLLTAADGEPLSIEVFEGNTSDPRTVASQIAKLKERFKVKDVVFVGDRGMVKKKGKEALKENGLKYISGLTNPQVRKLLKQGVIQLDLFDETVCEVQNSSVRLVLRKNDKVRWREHQRREDKLARLTELVEERNAFVMTSKRADPEAGLNRLIKWAGRYKLSSFVTLTLDDRRIVLTVDEEAKTSAGLLDGCYVLETDVSRDSMDCRAIDERYRSLQQVERDFRTLKNGFLEIRPIFVRKAARTRGHAFVAMLALKIIREAQEKLKKAFGSAEGREAILLDDALRILSRFCFYRWAIKDKEFLRLPQPDQRITAVFTAFGISPPRKSSRSMLAVDS